jgi:WD40 repeat protein
MRQDLVEWLRCLRHDSQVLRSRPHLLFQQALNQPEQSAPSLAAAARVREGREPRACFAWIDKSVVTPGALMNIAAHADAALSAVFSPDGLRLASGGYDRLVKLWNAADGRELAVLSGHRDAVDRVAFSPDGRLLASASRDSSLKLWDVAAGRELRTLLGHSGGVTSCAFSPDGGLLAATSRDQTISLWAVATGERVFSLTGHDAAVLHCVFSPDGKTLISASNSTWNKSVMMWDLATKREIFARQGGGFLQTLALSPDGRRLACAPLMAVARVEIVDVSTGHVVQPLGEHQDAVASLAFSPDGTRLASASHDHTLKIWNPSSDEAIATLKGHAGPVTSCAFSPDGSQIVSASTDGTLKLWDASVATAAEGSRAKIGGKVRAIAFSRDSRRVATAGHDAATIRSAETGQVLTELRSAMAEADACMFSPDGRLLLAGTSRGAVVMWDLESETQLWSEIRRAGVGKVGLRVTQRSFSPDGKTVLAKGGASIDDHAIRRFDARTGRELRSLSGHRSLVRAYAFRADAAQVVSGGDDQTVMIWNGASGRRVATLRGHREGVGACTFSPDGAHVVSGSDDRTLKLWDARRARESLTMTGHDGAITCCAFSPDGAAVVSGSRDTTVRLWDAASGNETLVIRGHEGAIAACAFSPDGTKIVSYARTLLLISDRATGSRLAEYYAPEGMSACAGSWDWQLAAVASAAGDFRMLRLLNLAAGDSILISPVASLSLLRRLRNLFHRHFASITA